MLFGTVERMAGSNGGDECSHGKDFLASDRQIDRILFAKKTGIWSFFEGIGRPARNSALSAGSLPVLAVLVWPQELSERLKAVVEVFGQTFRK